MTTNHITHYLNIQLSSALELPLSDYEVNL